MTKYIQNVALEDEHKARLEFSARLSEVLHEYRNKFCYFAHRIPFILSKNPAAIASGQGKFLAQTVESMDKLLEELRHINKSKSPPLAELRNEAEKTFQVLEEKNAQLIAEYTLFVKNYADPADYPLDDRHYTFITKVYEEAPTATVAHYMDQVRNDFLLLLRGESAPDVLNDFHPREALYDAINVGLFRMFKVPVVITEEGTARFIQVHANKGRLSQILYNILKNALDALIEKYGMKSESQGKVSIRLVCSENHAIIEVSDNGTGIPDQVQAHLFERGFTTKGELGNGIGLAYSFELVRSWGGEIQVESVPGESTTFRVILPAVGM